MRITVKTTIALLCFALVPLSAQGRLLPVEIPKSSPVQASQPERGNGAKTVPSQPDQPSHYLIADFWIDKSGVGFWKIGPCKVHADNDYKKDYRVEYETTSGKIIQVKASNPIIGMIDALIPTDESGRVIRLFSPTGEKLVEYFSPEGVEPNLVVEKGWVRPGTVRITGHPLKKGMRSMRWSWDGGMTWEGPFGMTSNQEIPERRLLSHVKTPGKEREEIQEKLSKVPHPIVEVFQTEGLHVYRHRYLFKTESE